MNRLEEAIREAAQPVQIDKTGFAQAFTFAPDFIGFDGHFPGNPILPGVVQLMAGGIATQEAYGESLTLKGISRTKFTRQVSPGETLIVSGKLKEKDDSILASIKITCGDETASTFTLTLSETPE